MHNIIIMTARYSLTGLSCCWWPGAYLVPRHSPASRSVDIKQWRHNEHDGVSNHQPYDCLLNRLFRHRSKKTSKIRATGHCAGNSPVTGEFPAQMASNAENVSIWWRHHDLLPIWRQGICISAVTEHDRSDANWWMVRSLVGLISTIYVPEL